MTTYVIDGYNLLHRFRPELLERGQLEQARSELEARLRSFQRDRASRARLVLVYDGDGLSPARLTRESDFRIIFSRPPQKADDVILDLCRDLAGSGDICVVTSDRKDIAGPVRSLGVRSVSSEEFAGVIEEKVAGRTSRGVDGDSREKPSSTSAREVDDWLREFDFHPDSDVGDEDG